MGIRRDERHQTLVEQPEGRPPGLVSVASAERDGGQLHERALGELALQPAGAVQDDVGAALRMGQQDPEPARPQLRSSESSPT